MRRYLFALALLAGTVPAMAEVPPEIVSRCAREWGDDYRMQLYCRKQQMKALEELNSQDSVQVPAPKSKIRLDFRICKVEGLEQIMFTTKTGWPNGQDGTQALIGKKTSKVYVGSVFWSTDEYIFGFAKPTYKGRFNVTVDSQSTPRKTW